jgi:Bacterial dipeptidyl-peptidase Sh3 domain/NlpC/P60 family
MAETPHAGVREVIAAQAPLRREPAPDAPLDTEALKGERVLVHETTGEGWCRVTLETDGYVGWVPAGALADPGPALTHKVAVPRTLAFPGPSIKVAPVEALSFGCRLAIARVAEPFGITRAGAYIPLQHLARIDAVEPDFVAVAERFLHVPYLWGGKSSLGLDCSALVQLAVSAAGVASPRDSAVQERSLGAAVSTGGALAHGVDLRRGDLLFWRGHVAIARDAATLIHANAFHMAVAIESIGAAVARIAAAGSPMTAVRRIAAGSLR